MVAREVIIERSRGRGWYTGALGGRDAVRTNRTIAARAGKTERDKRIPSYYEFGTQGRPRRHRTARSRSAARGPNKLISDYDAVLNALGRLYQARSYRPVVLAQPSSLSGRFMRMRGRASSRSDDPDPNDDDRATRNDRLRQDE